MRVNQNWLGAILLGLFGMSQKTYRLLVPHQISQTLGDLGYKVENQDEDHDKWTNHPPSHLPENIGLVANHKLNIFIKPAEMQQKRNQLKLNVHVSITFLGTFRHVCDISADIIWLLRLFGSFSPGSFMNSSKATSTRLDYNEVGLCNGAFDLCTKDYLSAETISCLCMWWKYTRSEEQCFSKWKGTFLSSLIKLFMFI